MTPILRRAVVADASRIAAFNRAMAMETEHKHLVAETVHRGVEAVFGDAKKGFYFVAEVENEIVGQLMITFEWSDWRDGWIWWIQSVYVAPESRRRGIFRSLFEKVLNEAKEQGDVVGVRLYVEKENTRAMQVYSELGMDDAGYFVLERMI